MDEKQVREQEEQPKDRSKYKEILGIVTGIVLGAIIALLLFFLVTWVFSLGDDSTDDNIVIHESEEPLQEGILIEEVEISNTIGSDAGTQAALFFVQREVNTSRESCHPLVRARGVINELTEPEELIDELLKGPTIREIEEGFATYLPQGLHVRIEQEGSHVTATLSRGLYNKFCEEEQAREQVRQTLLTYPGVEIVDVITRN